MEKNFLLRKVVSTVFADVLIENNPYKVTEFNGERVPRRKAQVLYVARLPAGPRRFLLEILSWLKLNAERLRKMIKLVVRMENVIRLNTRFEWSFDVFLFFVYSRRDIFAFDEYVEYLGKISLDSIDF